MPAWGGFLPFRSDEPTAGLRRNQSFRLGERALRFDPKASLRAGATIDRFCRLAGIEPVAAICELVNDDGTVMRGPQVADFAKRHGLKRISVADLIAYRQAREKLVTRVAEFTVTSEIGELTGHAYVMPFDKVHHYAFVYGSIGDGNNVPTRLHRANVLGDVFGGAKPIHAAVTHFKTAGQGVLVYLRDGTSGVPTSTIGEETTPSEREHNVQWREVGLGAQILRDLRISSIQLLATRSRTYVGLGGSASRSSRRSHWNDWRRNKGRKKRRPKRGRGAREYSLVYDCDRLRRPNKPKPASAAPNSASEAGSGTAAAGWNCKLSISAPAGSAAELKVTRPMSPNAFKLKCSFPVTLLVSAANNTFVGLKTSMTAVPRLSQNPESNCTPVAPVGNVHWKSPENGGCGLRTGEVGTDPSLAMIGAFPVKAANRMPCGAYGLVITVPTGNSLKVKRTAWACPAKATPASAMVASSPFLISLFIAISPSSIMCLEGINCAIFENSMGYDSIGFSRMQMRKAFRQDLRP
jgi:GTP cyclohydrolase II